MAAYTIDGTDLVRVGLVKAGNISASELGRRIGVSPQNLSNKLLRNNLSLNELEQMVEGLGFTLEVSITTPDGEKIVAKKQKISEEEENR